MACGRWRTEAWRRDDVCTAVRGRGDACEARRGVGEERGEGVRGKVGGRDSRERRKAGIGGGCVCVRPLSFTPFA